MDLTNSENITVDAISNTENNQQPTTDSTANQQTDIKPTTTTDLATIQQATTQTDTNSDKQQEIYKAYKPDSKFEKFYKEGNKETAETIKAFNELATKNNLSLEQYKSMADFMNNTLAKNGVLDTRSELEIKAEQEQFIKEEKAKLGKNADTIIKSSLEFVNNFGMFNEEQRETLKEFLGKNATNVSIVNTIKTCILGDKLQNSIPTDVNVGSLPDDYTLAKEYYNSETTDQRREEIINERIKIGRTNFLPTL